MTRDAFNPTDTPVVIDAEGRTLPGLDHGQVDPDAPEVQAAVEQGRLLLADDPDTAPPARKTTASKPKEN